MRRALTASALAAVSACVGFTIEAPSDCESLCQRALDCGFLPSMLGWDPDGELAATRASCVQRCGSSPATDAVTAAIVACFASTDETATSWCTDATSEHAEAWSRCPEIQRCMARSFGEHELIGDVALTIQLLRFGEYETHFEAIAALYDARAASTGAALSTCEAALCGQDACKELQCEQASCTDTDGQDCADEVCTAPEGQICSTTLCRVGGLTIASVCEDLGAQRITLKIYERDKFPVTQVFQDATAGINASCAEARWVQESGANYRIKPGPLQIDAEVVGELPASELAPLGLLPDGAPADDTPTAYCVKFLGPPVIVRAGENSAVVPIGDLADLATLAASGDLLPCEP